MTIRHPAYEAEQARLDQTVKVIEEEIGRLRADIKDPTDDYVKQVVNYKKAKALSHLEFARKKPYFGRVDFVKEETYEKDTVYIGKRGVVRSDTLDAVVIDWRAPIASLYYSGESKNAWYRTPKGLVRGEVTLKRNFAIEDGKLVGIYDGALKETIDREIGSPDEFLGEGYIDEFLASSLNETNDARLKDIVATIQSEQNEIIRAEKDRPIVVQGVAGSGKTTIALHRLSYLIYNYQDSLSSRRFMVYAPNRLFLNYISDVLPELGVEDVQQSTFLDWAARLLKPDLPKGWRILDPGRSLQLFFESDRDNRETRESAIKRLRFKGSLACRQTLEAYVRFLLDEQIMFRDLRFVYKKTNHAFKIAGGEIRRLFVDTYSHLPFRERFAALRKHLRQEMNRQVYAHLREQRVDLDKVALQKFERMIDDILERYLREWPSFELVAAYREIMADYALLRKLAPVTVEDDVLREVSASSARLFAEERIEPEDVAALLYLKHLLEGLAKEEAFDHAVIDEAQDLSALEIAVVALLTKRESLTIVGDIAQGIHAYRGLGGWDELLAGVFAGRGAEFYTLQQSYRSTIEIMRWANRVLRKIDIPGLVKAKPVLRHGTEPMLIRCRTRNEMLADIAHQVHTLKQEGFSAIAIVTKTVEESKKAYKALKNDLPEAVLLRGKDSEYPGGVIVAPAYLTKGLQFDAVLLLDVDEKHYKANEQDAKLLYVAMTRPVHRLLLYCAQAPSPLLADDGGQA